MRKLSAILLIFIFLFNLYGYRLMFNFLQHQSDLVLETSLDKNEFNESELITITVPLSLPYQNNQQNFERVDGELKVNGKIYKYVKRKIADGQLVLKCLPDHQKMRLESVKDEVFKYSNDLVQNNHSKESQHSKPGLFKNFTGEFDFFTTEFIPCFLGTANFLGRANYLVFYPSSPNFSPDQPPECIWG